MCNLGGRYGQGAALHALQEVAVLVLALVEMDLVLSERFGDDLGTRIAALFEIALMKIKDEKWDDARPILNEIIAYFDTPDSALTLPQEYKKLAIIDWKKLPENSAL